MSDPRSPRVRSAEETILDLHAKIESDAKVIRALMRGKQGNEMLTPWASQIIMCGCIGALIGMASGGALYIAGIYWP